MYMTAIKEVNRHIIYIIIRHCYFVEYAENNKITVPYYNVHDKSIYLFYRCHIHVMYIVLLYSMLACEFRTVCK